MPQVTADPNDRERTARLAEDLFQRSQQSVFKRTDRLFAELLIFEWLAGIVVALLDSPQAWVGETGQTHIHVWAALLLGGAIVSLPVLLVLTRPGETCTRHTVAAAQMLVGSLLIHLSGGRIETHFHVFGSLAFLAFYRDWRVMVTASIVVAMDHLTRGVYFPKSVYGVLVVHYWRWAEHTAWLLVENIFLIRSCIQGVREMRDVADHQEKLEVANAALRAEIEERERTAGALRESESTIRGLNVRLEHRLERISALHRIKVAISASNDVRLPLGIAIDQLLVQLKVDAAQVLLCGPCCTSP